MARLREAAQRGKVDMFIGFVHVEMPSNQMATAALKYLDSLGVKGWNYQGCRVEIHALPADLIDGVEEPHSC